MANTVIYIILSFMTGHHRCMTGFYSCHKKSAFEPIVAHQAGAYPSFCGMKLLGVFQLPSGWDASPSQVYPQH